MAWLFWFCEALALCVGAKPNVPNALAKNFLCALGIFLFFSVSGCCLVRYRSVGSGGRPAIATNVFRLCEVAEFQHKCSIEKRNLNLALNCHRSTKPAILQNRCYAFALLFLSSDLLSFLVGFVCVGKASSFAIFGLCVGWCELQMCLLLAWAFLWFHKY